jgi:hypothetical protein
MAESTGQPSAKIPDGERLVHEFKNHLSVIVGFCDVLLRELPDGDPKRADVVEIQKAGHAALALLPELTARIG